MPATVQHFLNNMLEQVLVIVGITVLILITPGPDMVLVLRNTTTGGRRAGLQTSAGVLTGNFVHIVYSVLGIGWLISQSAVAFSILRYAAAAYLIFLGVSSFRNDGQIEGSEIPKETTDRHWFFQGFVGNVLNPKGILFYFGVFTVVITPDTTAYQKTILILIMQSICVLFWIFFIATLNLRPVREFLNRSQKIINGLLGTLLVALGIRVAWISD